MHRFFTILAAIVATTALALALVPLALGESNHNKPTTSETCPNEQYGSPQCIPGDPADDLLGQLRDLDRDRVRELLTRGVERLLADQLGDLDVDRQIGALALGEVGRPLGEQLDELLA